MWIGHLRSIGVSVAVLALVVVFGVWNHSLNLFTEQTAAFCGNHTTDTGEQCGMSDRALRQRRAG